MNRRAFVTGLGAVLATPLGVEAQQARGVIDVGAGRDGVFAEENRVAALRALGAHIIAGTMRRQPPRRSLVLRP